jgi:hypothetical protein
MKIFLVALAGLFLAACSVSSDDSTRLGKTTTDPVLASPPWHLMVMPSR